MTEEPCLGCVYICRGETFRQGLTQFCVGFSFILCVKEKMDMVGKCLVRKGTSELHSPFRPLGAPLGHRTLHSGILIDPYMCS